MTRTLVPTVSAPGTPGADCVVWHQAGTGKTLALLSLMKRRWGRFIANDVAPASGLTTAEISSAAEDFVDQVQVLGHRLRGYPPVAPASLQTPTAVRPQSEAGEFVGVSDLRAVETAWFCVSASMQSTSTNENELDVGGPEHALVELVMMLSPEQALELFLRRMVVWGRRIDAVRQLQASLTTRSRRTRSSCGASGPPGRAVSASRRPPRGPNGPRMTLSQVMRGEPVTP